MACNKFQTIKDAVTNEWTQGMIDLIFAIISKNPERLAGYDKLKFTPTLSKAQQMILSEYSYYLSNQA